MLALKKNVTYYLDEYTNKINEASQQIKNNYIYIGFLLNELSRSENFCHEPYTISEYAEKEFGFSKSLTYSMMKVAERFCHGMFILDEFKNYGYSQLVELLPVSDSDLINFKSDMSVREIKEKKKELKAKCFVDCSFQTSGKEYVNESSIGSERIELAEQIIAIENPKHIENEEIEPYYVFDEYYVYEKLDVEAFDAYFGMKCNLGDKFRCVFYKL